MYIVLDILGNPLRWFKTKQEAMNYCTYNNRYDCTIITTSKSTERQKAAVRFVETVLNIAFGGNIEDKIAVSNFLRNYLEIAKQAALELSCEYESYINK